MRTLVASAAALLIAASCSGDGSGSEAGRSGVDALRAAADAARAQETVRTSLEMTTDFGGSENVTRGDGEFDFTAAAGRVSLSSETGVIEQPIEMIVHGSDMYEQFPETETTWTHSDWTEGGRGGIGQPSLAVGYYLEMLAAAEAEDVEHAGTEEIDGVDATRYEVDLTFDEVLDSASDELEVAIGAFAEGGELRPFEVWIDEDGLVRRLGFGIVMKGVGDSGGDALRSGALELFDYGADIEIEPPEEFEEAPG